MKFKVLAVLVAFSTFISLSPSSAWDSSFQTDDFGSKIYSLSTFFKPGFGPIENGVDLPDEDGPFAGLNIRCVDRALEVFILYFDDLGNLEYIAARKPKIQIRFNGGTLSTWTVTGSTDGKALFFTNQKALIQKLYKSKSFSVKLITWLDDEIGTTFRVNGLMSYKTSLTKAGCKT
jgi:hypothetical protein